MALANLDSITKRLIAQEAGGILARTYHTTVAATTAANTTSGYITVQRLPTTITLPSLTGYSGWELEAEMVSEDVGSLVACLEYDLGSLAVNTNTFTAGTDSSMPSRDTRISGTDYTARQTASMIPMLVATATLTATTPVITTTYVNEDGTGTRTCTMTLPTNASANSAFVMSPHLNTPDTGMQDVTNMSRSVGTVGTLRVKGIIPFAYSTNSIALQSAGFSNILKPVAPVVAVAGDVIAFYYFGGNASKDVEALVFGRPI